jgi:hypothetical protein
MSVLIVQGPGLPAADPWPGTRPAACAGHAVGRVRCAGSDALASTLRAAARDGVAMVLLEPGALAGVGTPAQARQLRQVLDTLPVPYIELHADAARALDDWLHPLHAPLAVVVTPHDRDLGYAMSFGIAARRLAAAVH